MEEAELEPVAVALVLVEVEAEFWFGQGLWRLELEVGVLEALELEAWLASWLVLVASILWGERP